MLISADTDKALGLDVGDARVLHSRQGVVEFISDQVSAPRQADVTPSLPPKSGPRFLAFWLVRYGDAVEAAAVSALFNLIFDRQNDPTLGALVKCSCRPDVPFYVTTNRLS